MEITSSPALLDGFMPRPDVRERFSIAVRAPAAIVLETACQFDVQRLWPVRLIFRTRAILMRARAAGPRLPQGILAETLALGWGLLHRDDTMVIVGARCQPWRGDVVFTAIPPDRFRDDRAAEHVKIVWTLEADALGPDRTTFSHETRVVANDAAARRRFLAYWRWARFGIVAIRYLMLPAVRREAEARWRGSIAARRSGAG